MLQIQQITAGKFYVNNSRMIMREVVTVHGQTILFKTHHLDTGNSCGSPSRCKVMDFLNWADHEATSTELTSLRYRKGNASSAEEQPLDWEDFYATSPLN